MHPFRSLLALLCLAALAPLAHAQFTGDYALTPSSAPSFLTTDGTAGAWTFQTFAASSVSFLDISDAPNSFSLQSSATGPSSTTFGNLSIGSIVQAGTIKFDYSASISSPFSSPIVTTASFTYTLNSVATQLTTSDSNTVIWNVLPGDAISFTTASTGGFDMTFNPPDPPSFNATTGSASVTISNFSFTPSAVPEPGTCAILFGLCSLGAVFVKKKRVPAA